MKGRKTERRINFANVTSLLALFIALGGATVYAAATIGAEDIKRNAVRAKHIKSNNVKRPDIAANAVNGAKITNNAVGGGEVAANAIGTGEVADRSILAPDLGITPQWSNVQYGVNWATYNDDFDFGPVQCWKDPFGFVHFRGAAERTGTPSTETIAVLPPACEVFPPGSTPALSAGFAVAQVDNNGLITGSGGAWINTSNHLGIDTAPLAGHGLVFDGLAIASGAR